MAPATNTAPEFAAETADRSIAENSDAGTSVGGAVAASDTEGATLTYSLGGTDASSFSINGSSGQITVGTGTILDHETKDSYEVTVSVHDGKDASGESDTTIDDTIAVTISVTDVDEEGTVALTSAQPQVGTELTASLSDPDGAVSEVSWQWASSATADEAFSDLSGNGQLHTGRGRRGQLPASHRVLPGP